MLGADLVFQTPFSARSPARPAHTGLQPGRRAAAAYRRAGRRSSPKASRASASRSRALQAAALRPRRLRLRRPADRRADHPVLDRRRRGDLPDDRRHPSRWPGCWALPYFPVTPTFPLLGPLGCDPAADASGSSSSASRSPPRRARRTRPTTRWWCSTSPTGARDHPADALPAAHAAAVGVPLGGGAGGPAVLRFGQPEHAGEHPDQAEEHRAPAPPARASRGCRKPPA